MSEFIELIYCSNLDGKQIIACAPMSECIKKGDIVCVDGTKEFYFVSCQITVMKGSDIYKFITEALGEPRKVTDKYSHNEIGVSEYE